MVSNAGREHGCLCYWTTMTLILPLVTSVHHHRGLRRHGGGAPLMGGVGYAWWPGTCTDAWWLVGLQGCKAAGWCLFYYRHSLANFLDWPLIFRANPSRRFLGQVVPRAFLEHGIFSSFIYTAKPANANVKCLQAYVPLSEKNRVLTNF